MAKRRMTRLSFKNKFNQPILGSDSAASLGELDLFSTVSTRMMSKLCCIWNSVDKTIFLIDTNAK